jgi:hypothetical protein
MSMPLVEEAELHGRDDDEIRWGIQISDPICETSDTSKVVSLPVSADV